MKKLFKKIHYNAPVILTFTFLSLFVLFLGRFTGNRSTMLFFSVYKGSMLDFSFYIRLFGHVLGHVDYEHFFNNFLLILLVGPILEEKYGGKNMVFMIVLTALITGMLHIVFFGTTMLLGASGVVFMLIVLSSFANMKKSSIPLTLIFVMVIFIGKEIYDGLFTSDNISHITHIIGGFCGGFFGYTIHKEKESEQPSPPTLP
ncbi:MAG: rhomboid family intramembrane serine protease [Thermotaleaceae bacterium]